MRDCLFLKFPAIIIFAHFTIALLLLCGKFIYYLREYNNCYLFESKKCAYKIYIQLSLHQFTSMFCFTNNFKYLQFIASNLWGQVLRTNKKNGDLFFVKSKCALLKLVIGTRKLLNCSMRIWWILIVCNVFFAWVVMKQWQ